MIRRKCGYAQPSETRFSLLSARSLLFFRSRLTVTHHCLVASLRSAAIASPSSPASPVCDQHLLREPVSISMHSLDSRLDISKGLSDWRESEEPATSVLRRRSPRSLASSYSFSVVAHFRGSFSRVPEPGLFRKWLQTAASSSGWRRPRHSSSSCWWTDELDLRRLLLEREVQSSDYYLCIPEESNAMSLISKCLIMNLLFRCPQRATMSQ